MFHVPLLFVDLFVVAQVLVRSLMLLYVDYGGLTLQLRSELVCRPVPFICFSTGLDTNWMHRYDPFMERKEEHFCMINALDLGVLSTKIDQDY